jgi:capsular exopolysaccharide synthesis family protein
MGRISAPITTTQINNGYAMNLVTLSNPQSPAAEAYRSLRTNLYFASLEAPIKTIAVTSPTTGEDKSSVLANLAVVMAQADKKVIVVDADLRHPDLHEFFGLKNTRGLGNILVGETADISSLLCQTSVAGLRVLTSGAVQSNPLDLLNSSRMTGALASLMEMADIVLFNTAPLGSVSDAAILASHVDGVLLVVQLGKTRREQAKQAKDLLSRAHARLLGAVTVNTSHD